MKRDVGKTSSWDLADFKEEGGGTKKESKMSPSSSFL